MDEEKEFNQKIAVVDGQSLTATINLLLSMSEKIAKREGYKNISGMDVIVYYLV